MSADIEVKDGDGRSLQVRDDDRAVQAREVEVRDEPSPDEIENEIESLRGDLGELVGELERRGRDAVDLPLQVRRHMPLVIGIAAVTVLGIVGVAWLRAREQRLRADPVVKARNLIRAVGIMARDPEALERALQQTRTPTASITAAATKIAGTVGQRLVARTF